MTKTKTKIAVACLVALIGTGVYLDHVRQRAQIATLEKMVQNLEHQMAAGGIGHSAATTGPTKRAQPGTAPDPKANLAGDLALRSVVLRNFRNAGRKTPRAAFETLNWAMANGDVEELEKVISMDAVSREKLQALVDSLSPSVRAEFPAPEAFPAMAFAWEGLTKNGAGRAYQIENETVQDDGTVRVDYANITGASPAEKTGYFQEIEAGWQVVVPPEVIDRLTTLAADPVKLHLLLSGQKIEGLRSWTDRH